MLTLKKVKELVGAPSHAKRTPSPKMLYEEGIVLLRREFDQGSHLTVYNSGYVLFSAGKRNTVFHAILENNKTCPEETLLQLGNMDGAVSADVLAQVSAEYFEEFNRRYGSHVHILDWALHLDEATPHIHERHVFDAVNQYGELCPQQDKALEELGFELPKPNEKKGKYNNRKMVFDEECRKLFISICQNHGLTIDVEPVYGGASYLEKQDFIIMNQKKRIEEKQAVLDGLVMKIEDVNAVIEEAVDLAYEKACEVVTKRVKEETVKHDVDVVKDYPSSCSRRAS